MTMLTCEKLHSKLHYDPETGKWTWLTGKLAGREAGTIKQDGYRQLRIDWLYYYSGKLAVLYMTGEWPKEHVDHVNRDRSDDKWENLREASCSDNNANRKLHSNNTSGYRGVSWSHANKKWHVRVNRIHIGFFDDLEEAVKVRDAIALEAQGSFAVLNRPMEIRT